MENVIWHVNEWIRHKMLLCFIRDSDVIGVSKADFINSPLHFMVIEIFYQRFETHKETLDNFWGQKSFKNELIVLRK